MIQIIGTKKCKTTAKAIRFFKERGVPYQFKDINLKALSEGEFRNISNSINADDLIDKESAIYKKKGFIYMDFDSEEEIMEDNRLLITPIVRNGAKSVVGFEPDAWKKWADK